MGALRNHKPWTHGEVCRLDRLRLQGFNTREIAALLGRTWDSVRCKVNKEKLTAAPKAMRYLEVLRNGKSRAEQAEELGLPLHALKRARAQMRRLGVLELPDQRKRRT